jgi:hypothetical protein
MSKRLIVWVLLAVLLGVLGGLLVGFNFELAGTRADMECRIPDMSRPPA